MEFTILGSSYFPLTFFFILEVLNFVDYGKITTHPVFLSSLFSHLPNKRNYFSLPLLSYTSFPKSHNKKTLSNEDILCCYVTLTNFDIVGHLLFNYENLFSHIENLYLALLRILHYFAKSI